jgi:hypothetical protein
MSCNCKTTEVISTICNTCTPSPCATSTPCTPAVPCDCPAGYMSSDCVNNVKTEFTCFEIETGLTLTETLSLMEQATCALFESITGYITLVNVGTGAEVYKGVNGLGQKQIRSLLSSDNSVDIVQGEDIIDFKVNVQPPTTVCITSADTSVTIVEGEGCFDLSVPEVQQLSLLSGDNISLDEILPNVITINAIPVQIQDGTTTKVIGDGYITPYSVETVNLQKTVSTFPYTLTNLDDKQTIFVNNGASDVVVNVPNALTPSFTCVFIQKGIGAVTITPTGTSNLNKPVELTTTIKGRYYIVLLEKDGSSIEYYLGGGLKLV